MKKIFLFLTIVILFHKSLKAQLALQDFNFGGLPTGWSLINVDGRTVDAVIDPTTAGYLTANAWIVSDNGSVDSALLTTSLFTPMGKADRWAITPAFMVSSASMLLKWEDKQIYTLGGITYTDDLEILIGNSTASVPSDFTSLGKTTVTPNALGLKKKGVNLSAYVGQNVRIAFRAIGTSTGLFAVDNVRTELITPLTDLALKSSYPSNGSIATYGLVGDAIVIGGVAANKGTNNITSFTIKYKYGTGPVVSETKPINLLPYSEFEFVFTTPVVLTGTASTPLKIWVEYPGDAVPSNDTQTIWLATYTTKPKKNILIEEGTGLWCSWCVRGIIYMDSIHKAYPNNTSIVAVHNSDPMMIAEYNDSTKAKVNSGFPNILIDRDVVSDPSDVFYHYNLRKDLFGVANIAVTPTLAGNILKTKVTVTPTVEVNADYRLSLIVTEDGVKGTTPDWSHANAYTGGAFGPMKNKDFDFVSLPNPVPYTKMFYDFVPKVFSPAITSAYSGAVGSLPFKMTKGTTYTYNFPDVTLLSTWNKAKLRAVVIMINKADGKVINAESVNLTTTNIEEVVKESTFSTFPNPANEKVGIIFKAPCVANEVIQIVNISGQLLASYHLSKGINQYDIDLTTYSNGIYFINHFSSNKLLSTSKISIQK